jgi:Flp pilus assembly secretin CpaC
MPIGRTNPRLTLAAIAAMALGAGMCAAAALSPTSALGADAMLRIEIDEAEIYPLSEPPATVIIGNPLVADATVHHGNLLVILGKNYGTTNVIVLDRDSREIANLALNVVTSGTHEVSLFQGSARSTLTCAPICEAELNVGDAAVQFDRIQTQIGTKAGLTGGAVSSGGGADSE